LIILSWLKYSNLKYEYLKIYSITPKNIVVLTIIFTSLTQSR